MSGEELKKCMLIGLPGSGKSSFIGAFWHVVVSGEINSAFQVTSQPEDREYLNQLRTNFLECKAPERTKTGFEKKIELNIKDNATGEIVDFIFPDLSGETFESQIEHRQLTEDYINEISECSSIMLFVNPDFVKEPHMISQAVVMLEDEIEQDQVDVAAEPQVKWSSKLCQTQVSLIELLQFIAGRVVIPCNICVIISAWDVITSLPVEAGVQPQPVEWLRARMPLLYQYLTANKKIFAHEIFGVSAQGGRYDEKVGNEELQRKIRPSERIQVQVGNNVSHDITELIKWLFNG